MRYYEELTDKYGFKDGQEVPPDADAVRELYVRWLNRHATLHGSSVRAHVWDHVVHNPCQIMFATLSDVEASNLTPDDLADGQKTEALENADDVGPDTIMRIIIDLTDDDYDDELLAYAHDGLTLKNGQLQFDMTAIDTMLEERGSDFANDVVRLLGENE